MSPLRFATVLLLVVLVPTVVLMPYVHLETLVSSPAIKEALRAVADGSQALLGGAGERAMHASLDWGNRLWDLRLTNFPLYVLLNAGLFIALPLVAFYVGFASFQPRRIRWAVRALLLIPVLFLLSLGPDPARIWQGCCDLMRAWSKVSGVDYVSLNSLVFFYWLPLFLLGCGLVYGSSLLARLLRKAPAASAPGLPAPAVG